jgi:hypothetical protein
VFWIGGGEVWFEPAKMEVGGTTYENERGHLMVVRIDRSRTLTVQSLYKFKERAKAAADYFRAQGVDILAYNTIESANDVEQV